MKHLIRISEVCRVVGLSRSEIYRLIALGDFPKQIPLGARAVAWDADEVQAWVYDRIESRQNAAA